MGSDVSRVTPGGFDPRERLHPIQVVWIADAEASVWVLRACGTKAERRATLLQGVEGRGGWKAPL